ncbi:MAG: 2-oxoacid:acceptor oxidoreductase family protein, partial [Alphaproteobacteria bacterium]|nr:2-oxoacid:acceptor oxidoreductase family protein [Alphaproteobacteria bacterium]
PPKRAFINELVCEGCGDCSKKSNCVSVEPLETEFGRKRKINQSSCNKDFSCVEGFCPSFVTVHGGGLKTRAKSGGAATFNIPQPTLPDVSKQPFNIVIGGIGGTGVTSIGAILGTAAHMEGNQAATLDMMGLAQKGGAVTSFVRIAADKARIHGPRVPTSQADVLIGCDIVMASKPDTYGYLSSERTVSVINDGLTPTAAFVTDNTIDYDMAAMRARIAKASRRLESIDAEELALRLLGDTIFANMLQTGYAYQLGEIPISEDAILKAIELNGAAVKANQRAFELGRLAAHDRAAILKLAGLDKPDTAPVADTYDDIVAKRVAFLTDYQNEAYAERYRSTVERIRAAEQQKTPGKHGLAEAAARSLFKLMAYKDEYEVARLYTDGTFHRKLHEEFEGNFTLSFHLAPPIFGATDPNTGKPRKMEFGPWMMPAFRVLASLKGLRGTFLDIFARNPERKLEVKMIGDYEARLAEIADALTPANHATAVALAGVPMDIKGYGYIKDGNYEKAKEREAVLVRRLHMTPAQTEAAALNEAAE